ncbi:MAG TPA: trypsin-like peptidase domain-containing protein [Tepidisphaeraceae bacterium]|jgi:serine protease Do|nr:trypsin-like peptidase domain-containing protein [Tepidisphaeraceae bacterium]
MNKLRKSAVALIVTGSAVGAWFGGATLVRNAAFAAQEHQVETTRDQLATTNDLSAAFRNVGKVLEPSVVNISVRKTIKGGANGAPFNDDLLRRFFKDGVPPGQNPNEGGGGDDDQGSPDGNGDLEQIGTGSGVIMEVDNNTGYILTNNHVAGGASEMMVTLADGRQIKDAKLVGADPKSDLAVVKITADHLIPAKWGDSSLLRKGDWILAFGSPFGYIGSMTHGIVSALDRSNVGILGSQGYEDFIQVDAPINPGNSGGPLVNMHGEVVGINTAIASRSGAFSGIGFAIPSKEAQFVYDALKSHGKVVRGWLGVSIADVARNEKEAESFGYKATTGVLVEQTFPNTPASGKLQAGDIITKLDGKEVDNVLTLRNVIASTAPNSDVKMTIFRDGKDQDVTLKLGVQPEDLNVLAGATGPARRGPAAHGSADALGMTLSDVTDDLAQKYNLGDAHGGALVTAVNPKSAAAKAGLRAGDLITKVGNKPVTDAKEAGDMIAKHDMKKGIRLYVTSPEGSRFIFIEGSGN